MDEPTDTPDDSEASESAAVEQTPDFPPLEAKNKPGSKPAELSRFGGVQVVLTAELGRAQLTLNEMMELSQGAVLELDRVISAPIELVAQGVPLGNGEVVVVDEQFAVRIKELYQV